MPTFLREGITFNFSDSGSGLPFVFQHGLGGDLKQPTGLYTPGKGVRLLSFDCRAHGATRPLGNIDGISIASFADDLIALLDVLSLRTAVVGGISMGAAVALNCAIRHPDRVQALLFSRPAWLVDAGPPHLEVYDFIASLIRRYGPEDGLEIFTRSEIFKRVLEASPDAAQSLVGQFQNPRSFETVVKLERIPHDSPAQSMLEINAIRVPTLVLANRQDPIHPYEYGVRLAREIPGAQFKELTPKSVDKVRHAMDVQACISAFLNTLVDR